MSDTPKKKKRPTDTNELAKRIVDIATGDEEDAEETPKATAGRKGGKVGGASRAQSLTAEQRSEIAKKAAEARWASKD